MILWSNKYQRLIQQFLMSNKFSVAAIILTYNEEIHLERCLKSLSEICDEIIIVDSFSNDKTRKIAEKYNSIFIQNKFINYSSQLNWALNNIKIKSNWILRIDADEYLTDDLASNIKCALKEVNSNVTGISFNRLMYFLDKPLKNGGMYPISHLRIWRRGFAYCEERWMDERMVLKSGKSIKVKGDLIDHNLNNISWWINKHNNYSVREAIDLLNKKYNFFSDELINEKDNGKTRRKLKNIYSKLPLFVRPFLFFIVRYFFQFGFLDGKRGFIWTFLQCLWYRFLVDVRIFEVYLQTGGKRDKIINYFKEIYNYNITN